MSIALMTQAWKTDLPAGRKMVLLALCDNANDQGECYPSIPMLATKCSMGERTVQQHISDMEADGIVVREMRAGRSTVYRINPRRFCTPANSAPPQISHPTPADSAPITIKEPSIEPLRKHQRRAKRPRAVLDSASLVELGVEPQVADDWMAIRATKGLPLTKTALDAVVIEVEKAGLTLSEALRRSCERGWAGFKASWLASSGDQRQGASGSQQAGRTANEKFNFSHLDRSGDELAMRASMARHGIPPGGIEGESDIPL